MHVAGDRTPREPRTGIVRRRQPGRVQQQQNLGRLAARRALGETSLFNRMHCRGLRRVRHEEQLIAMVDAAARPRAGYLFRQQQDEIVLGLSASSA